VSRPNNSQELLVYFSSDDTTWGEPLILPLDYVVFNWIFFSLTSATDARYILLQPSDESVMLLELGFKSNGRLLPTAVIQGNGAGLFDEQHTIPNSPTHLNSMYFDEELFGVQAYSFLHHFSAKIEDLHPPLGKVIISWGIRIFGMTPFGFRFMGAVFGILMLPLIYAFARSIFGRGIWPVIAVTLFAFDFMRFTMSRVATTDIFLVFFIIASYYFMYCYIKTDFELPLRKLLTPLALSGLFMGFGISVKWSGLYSALGLAVVFFIDLWQRRAVSSAAFKRHIKPIIGACSIFFGVIPVIVYIISYIPFMNMPGMNGLQSIIDNQIKMFGFHSTFPERFEFESPWYLWPFNIRSISMGLFYGLGNIVYTIILMGNPVVWYLGFVALVYLFFRKFDKTDAFLLIAYAAQLVPWIFISRSTFIYHYFPCVAFLILLLTRTLAIKNRRKTAVTIAALAVAAFIFYYPVLSGIPIEQSLFDFYLKTLPWQV
jgi:dolichyl-phosphate-mannose--protein O-mannosyl transferase